jgi:hypothetical protein
VREIKCTHYTKIRLSCNIRVFCGSVLTCFTASDVVVSLSDFSHIISSVTPHVFEHNICLQLAITISSKLGCWNCRSGLCFLFHFLLSVGTSTSLEGYDGLVEVSRKVMQGRNSQEIRAAVRQVLLSTLPPGAADRVRMFTLLNEISRIETKRWTSFEQRF